MIITRTPLRITLAGGGTDTLQFLESEKQCTIVSMAINKYIYISIHPYLNKSEIKLKYSETELVRDRKDIKHPIFRYLFNNVYPKLNGVEISVTSDIPSGTGMGSSSAFIVGLIKAIESYQGNKITSTELFIDSHRYESQVNGRNVGFQDFLAPIYGGIRIYNIDESMAVEGTDDLRYSHNFNNSFNLFYLGGQREANKILVNQDSDFVSKIETLRWIGINARLMSQEFKLIGTDIQTIGNLVQHGWVLKKQLSPMVSNIDIDTTIYGLNYLCYGSKLLGAGGTGFILTIGGDKKEIVNYMKSRLCQHVPFMIEESGSKVVYKE